MYRLIALMVVAVFALGFLAPAAHAGDTTTDVALGLAAFAVFTQLVGPLLHGDPYGPVYAQPAPPPVVYHSPPRIVVVESPAQIIVVQPAPAYRPGPVIHYKIPPGHLKKLAWKKPRAWHDD